MNILALNLVIKADPIVLAEIQNKLTAAEVIDSLSLTVAGQLKDVLKITEGVDSLQVKLMSAAPSSAEPSPWSGGVGDGAEAEQQLPPLYYLIRQFEPDWEMGRS